MYLSTITAHSGCEDTPRDSMDSIDRAIALGADNVEMDVRRAGDGTLRISHNQASEEEYASKPLLRTVFERIADTGMGLNCDLKEPTIAHGVMDMAKGFGFGPERLIFSGSTSAEQLATDPSIAKGASVYLNIEQVFKLLYLPKLFSQGEAKSFGELMNEPWRLVRGETLTGGDIRNIAELILSLGIAGVNMPHHLLTEEMAQTLKSRSIPFSVWTVNEAEDIARCLALGAGNVTTLRVQTALEQRRLVMGS